MPTARDRSSSQSAQWPVACQARFQQRWSTLRDRHVRDLAWLLDAPDLLDARAPCWHGQVATLGPSDAAWLQALDDDPRALHAVIHAQPSGRLGRYAEQLLTFYLQQSGRLMAHNVQVRNGNTTLGEFDFLLHDAQRSGIVHWEFATKFYLLASPSEPMQLNAFVGPNLADSLGAKMNKIMQQQLLLSRHAAAKTYLPRPVTLAQALVKGWLFYRDTPVGAVSLPPALGVAAAHCRGFWCSLDALDTQTDNCFVILARLEWLAPACVPAQRALSARQLRAAVAAHFEINAAPVMVAVCDQAGDVVLERQRGFIVPDDWQGRAAQHVRHAVVGYGSE